MGRIDYEHELGNGWDQWQNVVLLGMKEIRDDLKDAKELTAENDKKLAVATEILSRLDKTIIEQGNRLTTVENKTTKKFAFASGAWAAVVVATSALAGIAGLGISLALLVTHRPLP